MSLEPDAGFRQRATTIPAGDRRLGGFLSVPPAARGVVVFAHGSGSGRHSPRNQFVAETLHDAALATLLLDLLEPSEASDRRKVFDISLLADRLCDAGEWLASWPEVRRLPLGIFGASTGAAAALVAAARHPEAVTAVVSRGGRPDLAHADLPAVTAPTLLIVGGNDEGVLQCNREALALMTGPRELVIIPGATHLFPEQGALEEVARLAALWFQRHLGGDPV